MSQRMRCCKLSGEPRLPPASVVCPPQPDLRVLSCPAGTGSASRRRRRSSIWWRSATTTLCRPTAAQTDRREAAWIRTTQDAQDLTAAGRRGWDLQHQGPRILYQSHPRHQDVCLSRVMACSTQHTEAVNNRGWPGVTQQSGKAHPRRHPGRSQLPAAAAPAIIWG